MPLGHHTSIWTREIRQRYIRMLSDGRLYHVYNILSESKLAFYDKQPR